MTTLVEGLDREVRRGWLGMHESLVTMVARAAGTPHIAHRFEIELDEQYSLAGPTEPGQVPRVIGCVNRGSVSLTVPTNRLVSGSWKLSRTQLARLRTEMGFVRRDRDVYDARLPTQQPDRVADVVVRYFRDVVGVPDACLLSSSVPGVGTPEPDHPDYEMAVFPTDAEHLTQLVDAALAEFPFGFIEQRLGHSAIVNMLGDRVHLRACHKEGIIRIWREVSGPVGDVAAALAEVNMHNARLSPAHFQVLEDSVVAYADCPTQPFSRMSLGMMLIRVGQAADWFIQEVAPTL